MLIVFTAKSLQQTLNKKPKKFISSHFSIICLIWPWKKKTQEKNKKKILEASCIFLIIYTDTEFLTLQTQRPIQKCILTYLNYSGIHKYECEELSDCKLCTTIPFLRMLGDGPKVMNGARIALLTITRFPL